MILTEWIRELSELITRKHMMNLLTALLLLLIGIFLARRSRDAIQKIPQLDIQQRLLMTKVSYYGLISIAFAAALSQIGVDLRVLLGAAGVLTVAIGFAAQTSASNLISGLFLMVERPFVVGDVIKIGDIQGEVMSIDMLSSKIRTFNNLMVRVPNETLVKSNITNFSYYPIRRIDFNIGVSYSSDMAHVEGVLRAVAEAHPLCLDEPQPVFVFSGFGDSSINIQFQVWTTSSNLLKLQNELYRSIKVAFEQSGIEIPFPTRSLVPAPQNPSAQTNNQAGPHGQRLS